MLLPKELVPARYNNGDNNKVNVDYKQCTIIVNSMVFQKCEKRLQFLVNLQ